MTTAPATRASRATGPAAPLVLLLVVPALLALGAALLAGGGAPQPLGDLPGADLATRWLVPLAGLGARLCGVAVVGSLLVARLLPPGEDRSRVTGAARTWAAGWAAWAVVAALATAAERAGSPAGTFLVGGDLLEAVRSSRAVLTLLLTGAVALALAGWSGGVRTALPLALAGLLSPLLAGHAASGPQPLLGAAALGVHVAAASLWVGGLLALLVHLRQQGELLGAVVPRYSRWALGCVVALVPSGATAAVLQASGTPHVWTTAWAAVLALKALALVGLALAGLGHRRRTLPLLQDGRRRAFTRLASGELALMGVALGLAAALARTPVG